MKPEVKVEPLEAEDPTFQAGGAHTARALITNPTTKGWTYEVELYLGITKAATSGVGSVTVPAGGSSYVNFTVLMPAAEGVFPVFVDVTVAGVLIAHYKATEDVTIEISPAVDVGDITWT